MIYVVAFDPNKILTCWAHQNDSQNLSFVKAINEVGKKWPEILVKWPTPSFVLFVSKQSLILKLLFVLYGKHSPRILGMLSKPSFCANTEA